MNDNPRGCQNASVTEPQRDLTPAVVVTDGFARGFGHIVGTGVPTVLLATVNIEPPLL